MRWLMGGVLIVLLCTCGDDPKPLAPDATVEDFGSPCMNDGTSPLMACETPHGFVGWCAAMEGSAGICRKSCAMNACAVGTPTMVYNDCYCTP